MACATAIKFEDLAGREREGVCVGVHLCTYMWMFVCVCVCMCIQGDGGSAALSGRPSDIEN